MNKNAAEAVDAVKGFLNRAFRDHVSICSTGGIFYHFIIYPVYLIPAHHCPLYAFDPDDGQAGDRGDLPGEFPGAGALYCK